jgi:hypothetical protein
MKTSNRALASLFLVFILAMQAVLPAIAQIGARPPAQTVPDNIDDRFDTASVLANPTLFYLLQTDEERHPEKVFLRTDDMRFQTTVNTSGSLTKVAQYEPLDGGVKVSNMYYQREYSHSMVRMLWNYEGYNSSRLEANLSAPSRYHLSVDDNRVFHRLPGPQRVDFNLSPDASYDRTWQRTRVDGDVSLSKGGEVKLDAGLSVDRRQGIQAHSFYEVHRFNCTDCHTLGFGRNISYRTEDWYAGGNARLPWQSGVVDARFRSSKFENQSPDYTWNFGGSIGTTGLTPLTGSTDRIQEYQAYVGPGNAPWRAGAHYYGLDRTNTTTNITRNGQYISVQAGGRPARNVSLTGSYFAQSETNSLSTNLSNDKQRLTFQAVWTPLKTLTVNGRLGLDDRQYKINGMTAPTMHDTWFELRGDWRPTRNWHVEGRWRNDQTDHPYFPTDLAQRAQLEGQVTYSTGEVTAGVQLSHLSGSNTINDFVQSDFLAFVNARMLKRYVVSAAFADTSVNANVAQTWYLPMPQAADAAITPGIGGPLFLQSGLPYAAHNQYFTLGLTIPFGVKNAVTLTPTYRWVRTDTSANYLPIFPAVPADSQIHIVQNVYGLRLDAPVFGPNERMGLGWERDQWRDGTRSGLNGSFDIFMINFSKRF